MLSLSSCFFNGSQTESGKTNNSNTNESNNDNSGGSGNNESSDKNSNNLERFVSDMEKKNFTYKTEGKSTVRVDGNLIEVGDNTFNDIYESITDEFNQPVQYFYDYSNGKYVKDFYEASSNNIFKEVENFILDLTNLCWESVNGTKYKIDNSTLEILSTDSARLTLSGKITSIKNIGKTAVKKPNAGMVDDKTISGSTNPSNPSQSSPLIYDASTKKWDLNLFKNTLLKWVRDNDNLTQTMASKNKIVLDDFAYINLNNNNIDFGMLYSDSHGVQQFCNNFASDKFKEFLKSGKEISRDGLIECLDNLPNGAWWKIDRSNASIRVEYNKDTATSEQKKTFEAMIPNTLKDAAKRYGSDANAEVLYWFKTPDTRESVTSVYGFAVTWEDNLIVKVDNKIQLWKIGLCSSTYHGSDKRYENVIEGRTEDFNVGTFKSTNLDSINESLYSGNTKSFVK